MSKILLIIISAITLITISEKTHAQNLDNLLEQQSALQITQDSLQYIINTQRATYNSLDQTQKEITAKNIVSLEQQLFNLRTELSKIGREISIYEEQLATQNINNAANNLSPSNLWQIPQFTHHLPKSDIILLSELKAKENETLTALQHTLPLYTQLQNIHQKYLNATTQQEIDSLLLLANKTKEYIQIIDNTVGEKWNKYYDKMINVYAIMFDILPNTNRTILEQLANQEKQIRQNTLKLDNNNLAKNITVFPEQSNMLREYELQIAKTANLKNVIENLTTKAPIKIEAKFPNINFTPRILSLYSDVLTKFEYGYTNSADVPEIIIPYKGVYYCVEIFTLPNQLKHLTSLKGIGPAQMFKTKENKYMYLAGGFKSFSEAEKQVAIVKKAGFKNSKVICFLDGEITSEQIAKDAEDSLINTTKNLVIPTDNPTQNPTQAEPENIDREGRFKVVLRTKNSYTGEKLKEIIKSEPIQKNIIRTTNNNELVFTILEFDSENKANVFAQKVREQTGEPEVTVEEIIL